MNLNKETIHTGQPPTLTGTPEEQITKIIYDIKDAMMAQDVDRIMSFYAPEIVAFDLIAPLQYKGVDQYRKSWEKAFSEYAEDTNSVQPSGHEIHELRIEADENLAFCSELNHCFGPMKEGYMDMWIRGTHCFKKINGRWKIVHEQFSVPADFETGKALMDLSPGIEYLN